MLFKNFNEHLQTKGKTFIDTGTCSLHTVANAFCAGLNQLLFNEKLNLNEFAINLHRLFKHNKAKKKLSSTLQQTF